MASFSVADSSFTIASVGSGPLRYSITGGTAWGKVVDSAAGTLPPGTTITVPVRAVSGSLPPTTYTTQLAIATNEPASQGLYPPGQEVSFAAGATYALPWSMEVVLALVFPTTVGVVVVPNVPATPSTFSVVNFAGVSILVLISLPDNATSWMDVPVSQLYLQQADIRSFVVDIGYPVGMSSVCDPHCPLGVYSMSLLVEGWKQASPEEVAAANGTATLGAQLSPLADAAGWYVPIILPSISINANASVGASNATMSRTVMTVPSPLLPHTQLVASVFVVDAAQFPVPPLAALASVSLHSVALGNALTPVLVHSITYDAASMAVLVSFEPLVLDPIDIQVFVQGLPVPGGNASLVVTPPICVAPTTFETVTEACLCEPGYHTEANSCQPCPSGTYKSEIANGSVSTCVTLSSTRPHTHTPSSATLTFTIASFYVVCMFQ